MAEIRKGVGRPDKRPAVIAAARACFGRDGYARTGIDAIADEASVSTRTLYNHFGGKDELFSAVLLASATEVADRFCQRVLRSVTGADLVEDLVDLGAAFAAQQTDSPEHFAMVRQIRTEAPHFPPDVIDAWQQAGPLRVQRELADQLRLMADRGLLAIDDLPRAAAHFSVLVLADAAVRPYGARALTAAESEQMVHAGVHAFLTGYASKPGTS